MRKAIVLLAPLVASLAVYACDDSGGGSSSGTFDIDSGGGFDSGGPTPEDSSMPPQDSGTDSPVLPPGVTVMLLRGGAPVAGANVVYHDMTGAVLESKTTGADGKATSTPGMAVAQATLVMGSGLEHHLITWTAVESGDSLVANDNRRNTSSGTIVANGTPFSMNGVSASFYIGLVGDCFTENTTAPLLPLDVPIDPSCLRAKEAVLAQALDANGNLLALAYAKGAAAPPADAGAASATLGAFAAPGSAALTVTGVSPDDTMNTPTLSEIANDLAFDQTGSGGTLAPAYNFKVATGFADAYEYTVGVQIDAEPNSRHIFSMREAPAATTTIAFPSTIPNLDTVTLTTTNKQQPQLAWTTVGNVSLATANGGAATIAWADEGDNSGSWAFVVPAGSKGVVAPTLPAALSSALPTMDASFDDPSVIFAVSDLVTSPAQFRTVAGQVLSLMDDPNSFPTPYLPANGKVELSTYRLLPR